MSWVRIWVHLVFTTKDRTAFLNTQEIRNQVFTHIKQNADRKGIWIDCVNGYQEHAHCLISLGREQTISQVAQLIKRKSSFWINNQKLIKNKFVWQDDFWAASVSDRNIGALRHYIFNQEQHHMKTSFSEEVDVLFKKYL